MCCTLCTCQILAGVTVGEDVNVTAVELARLDEDEDDEDDEDDDEDDETDGIDEFTVDDSSTLNAELLLPLLSSPDPALLNELIPLSEPLSPYPVAPTPPTAPIIPPREDIPRTPAGTWIPPGGPVSTSMRPASSPLAPTPLRGSR